MEEMSQTANASNISSLKLHILPKTLFFYAGSFTVISLTRYRIKLWNSNTFSFTGASEDLKKKFR